VGTGGLFLSGQQSKSLDQLAASLAFDLTGYQLVFAIFAVYL
jgi:hypothetical protein